MGFSRKYRTPKLLSYNGTNPVASDVIFVPGIQNETGVEGKAPPSVPVPFSSISAFNVKLIGVGVEELPPATALNNPIIAPGMFPDAADKAAAFAKEKELDKKAKNMAHTLEDGIKSAGESLENLFKN